MKSHRSFFLFTPQIKVRAKPSFRFFLRCRNWELGSNWMSWSCCRACSAHCGKLSEVGPHMGCGPLAHPKERIEWVGESLELGEFEGPFEIETQIPRFGSEPPDTAPRVTIHGSCTTMPSSTVSAGLQPWMSSVSVNWSWVPLESHRNINKRSTTGWQFDWATERALHQDTDPDRV